MIYILLVYSTSNLMKQPQKVWFGIIFWREMVVDWLIDLDGVQEADNIGYCSWKVLMTAAQRRKPKKQKVPDDVLVCKVGIGAGYNVLHSKHLFSKLE